MPDRHGKPLQARGSARTRRRDQPGVPAGVSLRASEVRVISKQALGVVYAVVMVAVLVGVDVLIFRHWFWERLASNVGIVLVFAAFYFRFLR